MTVSFPSDFLPITSDRLLLRRFSVMDCDRFLAYRHDPDVARYQGWSMLQRSQAAAFLEEMSHAPIGIPGEWFQIAIAERRSNQLLGDLGIQVELDDCATIEIGFTLARPYQKQGYALEAVQALFKQLMKKNQSRKVVGIADSRNQASIRLLHRLGMTRVRSQAGEFRGETCLEHRYERTW